MALTVKNSTKMDTKVIYEMLKGFRNTQKHSHVLLEIVEFQFVNEDEY